jgi:hypothetical protein
MTYYDSTDTAAAVTYSPGSDIWTNNWNHIVYTRDISVMKLYLNGNLVKTTPGGNGFMQQTTTTVRDYFAALHNSTYTPDQLFNGLIDQVAIWNITLDQDQINALWNNNMGRPYSEWI